MPCCAGPPRLPDRNWPKRTACRLPYGYAAEAGQALPRERTSILHAAQCGRTLRFGAWIGGRERMEGEPPRLKLYAELPEAAELGLPHKVAAVAACPPLPGATPRILGVEPAREANRTHFRLPAADPLDLLPFLHRTGYATALSALDSFLPDGLRRLAGRRLGLSVAAIGEEDAIDVALFVSARTLFPTDLGMASRLASLAERLDPAGFRPALVTLGLDPAGPGVRASLGVVPCA